MTGTKAREYQDLERDSSNHLMEHDSRWVLGRYEEAASHMLEAGKERVRMGQLCFEAEEWSEAAEDWLSAEECFLRATARKQAADVLDVLHKLEADGKVPAERPALHAALRERERELKALNQRIEEFIRSFAPHGCEADAADERTLRSLLQHMRDLPGLPLLHYLIYCQASGLGQQDLAAKHLVWAATFAPEQAHFTALLGYLHIRSARPERAVDLGNSFLATQTSWSAPVRIMLANAFASNSAAKLPDPEQGIEVLRPLVERAEGDVHNRIAALALSATFLYELGREPEFRRCVQELDRMEASLEGPELRKMIAEFCAIMPPPEVNGTVGASDGLGHLLTEEDRLRLFQKAMEVSLAPLSLFG